jgi:hypothetical protein
MPARVCTLMQTYLLGQVIIAIWIRSMPARTITREAKEKRTLEPPQRFIDSCRRMRSSLSLEKYMAGCCGRWAGGRFVGRAGCACLRPTVIFIISRPSRRAVCECVVRRGFYVCVCVHVYSSRRKQQWPVWRRATAERQDNRLPVRRRGRPR